LVALQRERANQNGRGDEVARIAKFSALAALTAGILLPASAPATTVRLGPEVSPSGLRRIRICIPPCETFAQVVSPGVVEEAPASGLITSWRLAGEGARLRVLRPAPEGRWLGAGTSGPATSAQGEANAASLPIRAGDVIGVDQAAGPADGIAFVEVMPSDSTELLSFTPALADGGIAREASFTEFNDEVLLNADIVLAPVLSSLSPASGSTAGGNAVTIGGLYLDGASSVIFGSTPASSFRVDSPSQITAIAPPSAASTVDVRVNGPGGSSEVSPADRYTSTAPATTANTIAAGGPAVKPVVTGFGESSSRWRRGRSLPHISSAAGAPVGTTFSFSLNEPASVNLTFSQRVSGRRVSGRCVAPGHRNASRPRCKRTLVVGSFALPGHAGLDSVGFQGRLSRTKTLKPGSYLVSLTARESHGLKVVSRSLSFTIIS
jgi:hypothetical protein